MLRPQQLLYGPRPMIQGRKRVMPQLTFDQVRSALIGQVETIAGGQAALHMRSIQNNRERREIEIKVCPGPGRLPSQEIVIRLADRDQAIHLSLTGSVTTNQGQSLRDQLYRRLDSHSHYWRLSTMTSVMPGREILDRLGRGEELSLAPVKLVDDEIGSLAQISFLTKYAYEQGQLSNDQLNELMNGCRNCEEDGATILGYLAHNRSGRRLLQDSHLGIIRHFDR